MAADRNARSTTHSDPEGEFPLDLTTYFFHLFVVVGRYRDARLDRALKPIGLNTSRHRALSVIALLEPCPMTALADFSAVDRTTMTRTIDQLVAADLVVRATPATDRRQVLLSLTANGRKAYRKALAVIRRFNEDALDGVPEPLQRQALRAYERIAANIIADDELSRRLLFWGRRASNPSPR